MSITPCLNAYRDDCHYNLNAFEVSAYISDDEKDFKLKGFWSNRQFKHEFNPFHSHTGILSFVVWMKIPTESEHQHNLPVSANSNAPVSSDFQFLYQKIQNRQTNSRRKSRMVSKKQKHLCKTI